MDADSNQGNGNQGNGFATATVGPDFATGWGRVNALAAVNLMQDFRTVNGVPIPNRIIQDSLTHGRFKEYEFAVDSTINVLRVTLAWLLSASTSAAVAFCT